MEFNKTLVLNNILFLAKEAGKKIGELENAAHVSAGYISRLKKEENTTNPGIEFVMAVAQELHVTIDALCSKDFSAIQKADLIIINFIDKLITDTQSQKIRWERQTESFIKATMKDGNGGLTHPLFSFQEKTRMDYTSGYPDTYEGYFYSSLFYPSEDIELSGVIYTTRLSGGNKLYLAEVSRDIPGENSPVALQYYEFYLYKDNKISKICCSEETFSDLDVALFKMSQEAETSANRPYISDEVMSAIDSYMNDEDDLPF